MDTPTNHGDNDTQLKLTVEDVNNQSSITTTPVTHVDRTTQQKTKTATKVKSVLKSVENRTLVIEMKKRITEQQKTIDLLEKRLNLTSIEEPGDVRKTAQNCVCNQRAPSILENSQYQQLQRQIEMQSIEARMKALETQTLQNMSIQTAMTTQLTLQIQQQTITMLQNQNGSQIPHNYMHQNQQTSTHGTSPQHHIPIRPHYGPVLTHYGPVRPPYGLQQPQYGPVQPLYGSMQPHFGLPQTHLGTIPNFGQLPPPPPPTMFQHQQGINGQQNAPRAQQHPVVQPPPYKTQPGLIGKESNDQKVLECVPDPNLKCRQHHHTPDREETPHIANGKIGGMYQDQPGDRELYQDRSGPVPRSAWMAQAIPGDHSTTMEKLSKNQLQRESNLQR